MLASCPHHTSTLMLHQNTSLKGQTHRQTTEVMDAAWPLGSITSLSVGRRAWPYCGGPGPSCVTVLPEPDPLPPELENLFGATKPCC